MAKINVTKPRDIDKNNKKSISVDEASMEPSIDFRYLHESNRCWKFVYKKRKSKVEFDGFCDIFQGFVSSFTKYETIGEALSCYSSHKNGSKVSIDINFLPSEIRENAKKELVHLHLKPNGNGKELIWGFCDGGRLYLIAFDPDHELI